MTKSKILCRAALALALALPGAAPAFAQLSPPLHNYDGRHVIDPYWGGRSAIPPPQDRGLNDNRGINRGGGQLQPPNAPQNPGNGGGVGRNPLRR